MTSITARHTPYRATRTWLALLVLLGLLGACATTPEEADETGKWTAEEFYQNAARELKSGNYPLAIEYYEKLESRFPFGQQAQQALLDTIYAYYKHDEPETAISTADRFIKLHPRHANVDYAYYLRGLASMGKNKNPLDFIAKQDPATLDPKSLRESFQYFAELVKLFPDSRYSLDAVERMKYLRNTLAMHEIHVARHYMERGALVAAANRAKYVVENFPLTPAVPEALGILVKAYREMKMDDLADDALQVLNKNYPAQAATIGM